MARTCPDSQRSHRVSWAEILFCRFWDNVQIPAPQSSEAPTDVYIRLALSVQGSLRLASMPPTRVHIARAAARRCCSMVSVEARESILMPSTTMASFSVKALPSAKRAGARDRALPGWEACGVGRRAILQVLNFLSVAG